MKLNLTDEQKETLSFDDVAYLILKNVNKKIKIQELFKMVIKEMSLSDEVFENQIEEFFEQIITDKRFIMLDKGYCDLKVNHAANVIIEDDEEIDAADVDYEVDDETNDEDAEDNYDSDSNPEDDADDDLQDLVIIDDNEDLESDML